MKAIEFWTGSAISSFISIIAIIFVLNTFEIYWVWRYALCGTCLFCVCMIRVWLAHVFVYLMNHLDYTQK